MIDDARLRQRLGHAELAWENASARRAAVLAPLCATAAGEVVLLLVRAATLRLHPGQIGFPGGADAGDANATACALRETHEEAGIAPTEVDLLGSLGVRTSSSGYRVHCVVGRIPRLPVHLDAGEVERVLLLPTRDLLPLERWQHHAPITNPALPPSPHLDCGGEMIWGLTGRFLFDLAQLLVPDQRDQ